MIPSVVDHSILKFLFLSTCSLSFYHIFQISKVNLIKISEQNFLFRIFGCIIIGKNISHNDIWYVGKNILFLFLTLLINKQKTFY